MAGQRMGYAFHVSARPFVGRAVEAPKRRDNRFRCHVPSEVHATALAGRIHAVAAGSGLGPGWLGVALAPDNLPLDDFRARVCASIRDLPRTTAIMCDWQLGSSATPFWCK